MEQIKKLEEIEKSLNKLSPLLKNKLQEQVMRSFKMKNLEFPNKEAFEKRLERSKQENDLLKIGIVGRVKAGKSSFLNALFFEGESVLPKAATPMTAALSVLAYGTEQKAKITFFSEKDIQDIKNKAQAFDDRLREMTQQEKKTPDEAKAFLEENYPNLAVAKAMDEKIEQTPLSIKEEIKKGEKEISINNLQEDLKEYVGANGKYTALTHSTTLYLPIDSLKGIEVYDTPGMNDPVAQRSAKTNEFLSACNVVFVLSPSSQFMAQQEWDLFNNITTAKGIRELFIIASQCDNDLVDQDQDSLEEDLRTLKSKLYAHFSQQLQHIKYFPQDVREQLMEGSQKRFLHSSGISKSIQAYLEGSRAKLDEGEKHIWNLFQEDYPDDFNSKQTAIKTLKLLANIESFKRCMDDVRERKADILKKEQERAKEEISEQIRIYKEIIQESLQTTAKDINQADIQSIQEEQKNIEKLKKDLELDFKLKYKKLCECFDIDFNDKLLELIRQLYENALRGTESSAKIETETSSRQVLKDGLLNGVLDRFGYGKYETRTEYHDVFKVYTQHIAEKIRGFKKDIEDKLSKEAKTFLVNWKQKIPREFISLLTDEQKKQLGAGKISDSIFDVVDSILPWKDIVFDDTGIPKDEGVLRESSGEEYLRKATAYIQHLEDVARKGVKDYVASMNDTLRTKDITQGIFDEYTKKTEELSKMIAEKEKNLQQVQALQQELEKL